MRITFTQTVQYETGGRNQGPIFEKGSTHDFSDDFARRWLRRNVAVVMEDAPVAAPVETLTLPEGGGRPGNGGGRTIAAKAKALCGKIGGAGLI